MGALARSACQPITRHERRRWVAARSQAPSQPQSDSPLLLPPASLAAARVLFATAASAGHDYAGHAECAARVPAILATLEHQGLGTDPRVLQLEGFSHASVEDLLPIHNGRYLQALERVSTEATDVAGVVVESAPTYVTQTSWKDVLRAAGAVLALVDHVVAASQYLQQQQQGAAGKGGTAPAGFAICRPPGHHSLPQGAMGFCLLNNVAIAARHAQQRHGLARVAIFDFDVHHGNGTEAAFYADPSVLFISTHMQGGYPNTGKAGDGGRGEGEGFTLNVPLPGEAGHEAAVAVFDEVVAPALRRFQPDIILVSAGYDAHFLDPLGGLQYRSSTYHALGASLGALAEELCGGRLVFLLEGGYNLQGLGEGVANTFCGLIGAAAFDPVTDPKMLREEPLDKVRAVIAEAQRVHGL